MKRSVALGALWLLAAAVAVTIAWQGVSVVGDQVTDERPAALDAREIERRLDLAAAAAATSTSTSTADPPAASTSTTATDAPPSTAPPGTDAPPPTAPATTAPLTPTTTPARSETRTYSLVGGTASLRFSPSGVEVVFANPAAGFSVEVEPEHGNGVKVEFESASHGSRVDGWWDGGPLERIREQPED